MEERRADPAGGSLLPRGSSSPHEDLLIVLLSDGFSCSNAFFKVCCDCTARLETAGTPDALLRQELQRIPINA